MIFETPALRSEERDVLGLISDLRTELSDRVAEPKRWTGSLRKMAFARAVQGSNSIEGYNASLDDVVAAVEGEPTLDADEETTLALAGYRDAMTYVLQLTADDRPVRIDEGTLKSLHFMMIKHELSKNPGRWRPGDVFVRRDETGEILYQAPDADLVPSLIQASLEQAEGEDAPVLIKASMAHLNLVLIHPFSDGNGRMGRCLQTLILARDRLIAPVFSSIEEFLGRNTDAYYQVLADVGTGSWHPERDARPWTRFCLRAHYIQMRTFLRRQQEVEALWLECVALGEEQGLPERATAGLMDAAHGLRVRRSTYIDSVATTVDEELTEVTATRDLKQMVDAGLLTPVGERRRRYYVAAEPVEQARARIRGARPPRASEDPFEVVREARQLRMT